MKMLKYFILVLLLTMQVNSAQSQLILFETGSGDRPYKVYTALLTQSGTNAPVAIVLENTLGEVDWQRNGAGDYGLDFEQCALLGITALKASVFIQSKSGNLSSTLIFDDGDGDLLQIVIYRQNPTTQALEQYDNLLENSMVEIRVYP